MFSYQTQVRVTVRVTVDCVNIKPQQQSLAKLDQSAETQRNKIIVLQKQM